MSPQATNEAGDAVVGFVFFHNNTINYVQVSTEFSGCSTATLFGVTLHLFSTYTT